MDAYDKAFVAIMLACLMLLGFAVYEAAVHPPTTTVTVINP